MANEQRQYHKGDVKQDAVNIAFAIVQAEGGKALTMRHLANEIGISHTALYRHYSNKNAVLVKVAAKGFKQLMLKMAESLKDPKKASPQQLVDLAVAYIEFAFEHGEIYRLMYGHFAQAADANVELNMLSQKMFEILRMIIQKGQSEAVFNLADSDFLAFSIWSMIHGYVELNLNRPDNAGRDNEVAFATVNLLVSAIEV